MLKKIITKSREKDEVRLEMTEMQEIAERLTRKLEASIKKLETAEKRVDEKLQRLEQLIEKAELLDAPAGDSAGDRHREILALVQRGLSVDEIAKVLNMPRGEIELILSLSR